MPEHFRPIRTDHNLRTTSGNSEARMEVPVCVSMIGEELTISENLRMASQIKTHCDKDIMAAYVKDIGLLPTKVCV